MEGLQTYTAFAGSRCVAAGPLPAVLRAAKGLADGGLTEPLLFFEDGTGRQVDFDLRGTPDDVVARAVPAAPSPRPGRPRLGVVSREVSLLPRHWEWLAAQPNGTSAALRRLVDEARRRDPEGERVRLALAAANRVMTAIAGNRPGYEEATRALFAGNRTRFDAIVEAWPPDVRAYVRRLADEASPDAGQPRERAARP